MNYHTKLLDARVSTHTANEDDLRLINEFAQKKLSTDEVYVGRMRLTNDQTDCSHERFPLEYLEQFKETITGKSLLIGHDHKGPPQGLFFKAEITTEQQNGQAVRYLTPSFYLVRTTANEHLRAQVDGGAYRYVSIGYHYQDLRCDVCNLSLFDTECPHIPGCEYDGHVSTATYAGRGEAVEGSIVYLGAQYGARLLKAREGRTRRRLENIKSRKCAPKEDEAG